MLFKVDGTNIDRPWICYTHCPNQQGASLENYHKWTKAKGDPKSQILYIWCHGFVCCFLVCLCVGFLFFVTSFVMEICVIKIIRLIAKIFFKGSQGVNNLPLLSLMYPHTQSQLVELEGRFWIPNPACSRSLHWRPQNKCTKVRSSQSVTKKLGVTATSECLWGLYKPLRTCFHKMGYITDMHWAGLCWCHGKQNRIWSLSWWNLV